MNTEDRRAPGAPRTPFDALVEVGGALGPSFEAQAVNVSEDGMQLKTAYLPEQGQPLTCRFDSGPGQSVLASGEVVWSLASEKGGEFGIRFTDMDAESVDALKRVCGLLSDGEQEPEHQANAVHPGSKVRLHIEGLASPMRAKIRDSRASAVTVGSDLSFLQVGRQLELEDAQSGNKRPASIDHVEVAVDPASHIPQLVVTLRYADVKFPVDGARSPAEGHRRASMADDLAAVEEASAKMKGALANNLSRVGPAVERLAGRVKTTISLLAKRRMAQRSPLRRTTAPPPGGGLHASGRRVVRGEPGNQPGDDEVNGLRPGMTKRKAMLASGVMLAAILGAIAIKKSHHESDATATPAGAVASEVAPPPPAATMTPATQPPALSAPFTPSTGGASADLTDSPAKSGHKRHARVTPFGNGPVHHGNVLRLKMDDPIESIEGAQQPTGFTVKIPGRKAVEAAAPLAARDSRIAAIKVSNDGAGAALTVTFKDGVPNYQVSARGDILVIALAPAGPIEETMAKKDEKGGKAAKHGKHEKRNSEQEL